MSDDLAAQLRSLQSLRATLGEELYAQGLTRLRSQFGAEQVDALLEGVTATHSPTSISVSIATERGTIAGAPVNVIGHADNVSFPPPSDPAEARCAAALVAYLRRTIADCNALPLGQIDRTDAAHARPLQLARLYISLNTTRQVPLTDAEIAALPEEQRRRIRNDGAHEQGQRPTRALAAVEALGAEPGARLMLLGAPGSGKSTLVSHLALCLAGAALAEHRASEPQPEGGWLACSGPHPPSPPLPFAARTGEGGTGQETARSFWLTKG